MTARTAFLATAGALAVGAFCAGAWAAGHLAYADRRGLDALAAAGVEVLPIEPASPHGRAGSATRRKTLPRWEVELFARTLLGECGRCGTRELQAIAAVILNRHAAGRWGREIGDVVTFERRGVYAFSTWDPRQNKLEAVGPHVDRSRAFARVKTIAAAAWQDYGQKPDVVCGAVHFYHPSAMVPAGRVPRWAQGKPTKRIGGAVFVLPRAGACGAGDGEAADGDSPRHDHAHAAAYHPPPEPAGASHARAVKP